MSAMAEGPGERRRMQLGTGNYFRTSARRSRRSSSNADGTIGTASQGGYALALAYDLLDGEQVRRAGDHLVAAIDDRGGHLSTGMVTTHLLLPALSKVHRTDAAYRLFDQTTYPSWVHFLKMGGPACGNAGMLKMKRASTPDGMLFFQSRQSGDLHGMVLSDGFWESIARALDSRPS